MQHRAAKLAVALAAALTFSACKSNQDNDLPAIDGSFSDGFERDDLGADYRDTSGGAFKLANGALQVEGAYNRPLWLKRPIPERAVIELDVWSQSPSGDIKVELYGDGRAFDPDKGGYTSTGYVVIMGGWNNSKSMIARGNEHGKELVRRIDPKVEVGRRYHWKIERNGGRIDWYVDDLQTPFLSLTDPAPLTGKGHSFFAFGNWESNVGFDNLIIKAL